MSDERREYFRIDDEIALEYRPVSTDEAEQLRNKIHSRVVDRFTAASSFTVTSRQLTHVIRKVQTQTPELARCLQAIDQKLNMIAQLFVSEEINLQERPTFRVNLSAGGLAFRNQHEIKPGTLLELRMVLLPALVGILTLSRVIQCERVNDGDLESPWQVSVVYEYLREADRELLVRHIMSKETEQLRSQRQGDV